MRYSIYILSITVNQRERNDFHMITIKNEFLTVSINSLGAELSSVKDNATQHEYLWQGNPSVWSGQAPLLFPITGRLLGDTYTYNGKKYSLPKHGFARKSEFSLMRTKENLAVFGLFDIPRIFEF